MTEDTIPEATEAPAAPVASTALVVSATDTLLAENAALKAQVVDLQMRLAQARRF